MDQFGVQKPSLKAIAKTPEFPKIELTADEVIAGTEFMGGVIKNIQNDNRKVCCRFAGLQWRKNREGSHQGDLLGGQAAG